MGREKKGRERGKETPPEVLFKKKKEKARGSRIVVSL